MAKKARKKASGKSGKTKGAKAKSGKKTKKADLGPKPVKTGKGASAFDIANDFVAMFNARTPDDDIWKKHFSKKIVSIEGGMNQMWEGMKALKAKSAWFLDNNTVHSCRCDGPYIGATGFAVKFTADIEAKGSGHRATMEELAFYTVKGGKIVQEEFLPFMPAPTAS
ncbi:MAG: nuclear transport factor 2 family protein [Phycisphaeraceae bacterium]|nr:nuclear transport factor 2 family protein [Phycisphaeraceae bacterium]MCW5754811.1 nuclear transport factor 2 family protein [Phycisphaeraceae bacterium]